ncbi:AEC family transporter [Acinetobacter sp. ANC 4178]|uniref:AEC family transporter n=1 Tax=Acinetobacter sp. ANC 4178 TaxID=2529839 RepID=UPI00103FB389|nr:AEC family transporter [Acinetobacter sp. ANC 4178]TCB67144.1 AEC family transporter [Acinetobacter sp. ANC 4178]
MVLSIILPIILLVLLGFACVKGGLMLSEQIKALSAFVIKIALPAFLLHALASRNLNEIWHPSYFIAYGGGSLLLFVCAFVLYRHYFQYRLTASAVMAMGASMSNTGFIGTAILTMLIGQHAAIYISLTLIIENLLIVALVLMIAEAGLQQQGSFKQIALPTLVNLLKNPVILAIILGMSCVLLNLKLPAAIDQILAMLGKTASPLALFVIGGSLVGIGLKAVDIQSLILVSFKIVLMPLTIFLLLSVLPNVSQEMLYAGTLLAALPMPIAFGIFGQTYGLNEKALTPLMLSTVLGFGVVSGLIAFWWG